MIKPPKDKHPFDRLVKVMEALRSRQGCPWDRKQTPKSLKPSVIEEAYEVVEAIDSGEPHKLKEELGDLLLQSVFLAQIAAEKRQFTIYDSIEALTEKLVRRHPHVFGSTGKITADEQLRLWEQIKRKEKSNQDRKSAVDGVPKGMPALLRSRRVLSKAGKARFEWNDKSGAWGKLDEELGEFRRAARGRDRAHAAEELGDVLMALVNVARYEKLEPEAALHASTDKVIRRVQYVEKALREAGKRMEEADLSQMLKHWDAAKRTERKPRRAGAKKARR